MSLMFFIGLSTILIAMTNMKEKDLLSRTTALNYLLELDIQDLKLFFKIALGTTIPLIYLPGNFVNKYVGFAGGAITGSIAALAYNMYKMLNILQRDEIRTNSVFRP